MKAWEERLAGLEPRLEPVTPPATVWRGIENKLELRKPHRRPAMRWLAIAASLAFFVVAGIPAAHAGAGRRVTPPAARLARSASFLQADPQTIYWRVEVLGDNQELSLHVHVVHDLPPGKAHELWALPEGGGARCRWACMPHTGDHHRVLTAAQRAALAELEADRGQPRARGRLADRRSDRSGAARGAARAGLIRAAIPPTDGVKPFSIGHLRAPAL